MEMDAAKIGDALKVLRGNRTQEEVADALGISKSALSMYEQGERIPRDNIKIRIAEYYHVPIFELFYARNQHGS